MAIKKIELSAALNALATQSNIDKVTGTLGGVAANISKSDLASVVAGLLPLNLSSLSNVADMNEVHSICGQGLTMLSAISSTANKPDGVNGIFFHVQRLYNDVSGGQLIYQFTIRSSKIYIRTGVGNESDISWSDWRTI